MPSPLARFSDGGEDSSTALPPAGTAVDLAMLLANAEIDMARPHGREIRIKEQKA